MRSAEFEVRSERHGVSRVRTLGVVGALAAGTALAIGTAALAQQQDFSKVEDHAVRNN